MDGFSIPTDSFSLLPEELITSLTTTLTMISIVSVIGFALFLILYLVAVIRRWKVESATLAMHKDVQAIRALLEAQRAPAIAPLHNTPETPPSPRDITSTP